jgi:DNA-directed RNA polymerase subunit RPC12/RpoP
MKPKSKLQVDVISKSQELHRLNHLILPWAVKSCLKHVGYATKNRVICMDCGEKFSSEIVKNKKAKCPNCKTKLEIQKSQSRTFEQKIFVGYAHVVGIYQVVRYFEVSSSKRDLKKANYHCYEILQHWTREDGKTETVARIHTLNGYCDSWSGGTMEIRKDYGSYSYAGDKYDVYTEHFHPKSEFKPEFEKIGINKNLAGLTFCEAKRIIPSNPQAETLLKAKQYDLLSFTTQSSNSGRISRNWASIKICLRNNYIVKDASMWFDYIDLLRYFNLDLHNSHYVCPADLKEAHDQLMDRKRKIQQREKLEKQREKLLKDQDAYAKQKGKFFGILFTDGKLKIKTIESVEEFMKEGDTLHHCVFTNEYYKKPEALILSARIDNKPIETIEVSLKNFEIVQSRGYKNKPTEYHDQIINLVRKNIKVIQEKKTEKGRQKIAV